KRNGPTLAAPIIARTNPLHARNARQWRGWRFSLIKRSHDAGFPDHDTGFRLAVQRRNGAGGGGRGAAAGGGGGAFGRGAAVDGGGAGVAGGGRETGPRRLSAIAAAGRVAGGAGGVGDGFRPAVDPAATQPVRGPAFSRHIRRGADRARR